MNSSDERMAAKLLEANQAADAVDELMRILADGGLRLDAILAGLHGAVVAKMAAVLGGDVAADACLRAAARVQGLPPAADVALASAVPMGRA